ncbi:AMP-binding protein [Aeromicrobium sp. SMF47]|uniref:class I adenylate-forming enzyme family protein n=1 Tax=Aeromicrobium yanjiei TaxID=2662028 RepID=UPI00129DDA1C|nr:AMP-binding protein [Aeromicrobium yanjiei]MRJ77336.1 AMP-binding protein [Aeromicrobium yanjiei]
MNIEQSSDQEASLRSTRLLSRRIQQVLAIDPEASALAFGSQKLTWSYFRDAVEALEKLLAAEPRAHRIGIVLRNRPGSVASVIATIATGREIVTLSPHLGDAGLGDDIRTLSPDVVIADPEDWAREHVVRAAADIGAIAIECSGEHGLVAHDATWTPAPSLLPATDIAVLMMTSGTTGRPKRVELTYERMTAAYLAAGTPIKDTDPAKLRPGTAILWASLAHISGLYFAVAHVLLGRETALMEKFEVDPWVELMRRSKPPFVGLPPTAMRMVLDADVPKDVFEGVKAVGSGTAPLPAAMADAFEDKYGIPVLVTYGATEFAGAIAGWSLTDRKRWGTSKRGSVGRAHHGIDLRIVDRDSLELLPSGEIGLLEARGGQLPETETGWTRTTDLASIDEDGFLYIHGRADDAINRGGFKIPPSVIEDALLAHPAVLSASCVGLPHERLGEVPAVAVTLRQPVEVAELWEWLDGRLTRYQRPVDLKIVDELPLTPSMKVSRPLVKALFTTPS